MTTYKCFYGEISVQRGGKEPLLLLKWENPIPCEDGDSFKEMAQQYLRNPIQLNQHLLTWTANKEELLNFIDEPDHLRDGIEYGVVFMEDYC